MGVPATRELSRVPPKQVIQFLPIRGGEDQVARHIIDDNAGGLESIRSPLGGIQEIAKLPEIVPSVLGRVVFPALVPSSRQ